MSKSFLRFVLLTMISSVIAQKKRPSFIAYVENGDPVDKDQYPFFAYLKSPNVACGGTLIAPDLMLTAAHCATNFAIPEDASIETYVHKLVYVGAYNKQDLNDGTQVRHCVEYEQHPSWNKTVNFNYDWALCKLNETVVIDAYPVLNNDDDNVDVDLSDGTDLTIMGLGRINANARPEETEITLDATIPAISNTDCENFWSKTNFNKTFMLCAGEIDNTGTCKGDSGGPLIRTQGGIDYHVGLTSFGGDEDCVANPSVYARTSAGFAWIKETACDEMDSIASFCSSTASPTANPTATPTAVTGSPTARTDSPTAATGSPTARTDSPTAAEIADATASPTVTPPETDAGLTGTPTGQPSLPPAPCPDDIALFNTDGTTAIELDQAVRVIRQDTETVTVRLYNAWTSSADVVQSIFYQYKKQHDTKCYEEQNVVGGATYEDVTIQCLVTKPYAELEIWIEDGNGVLDVDGDNAKIPKCCKQPDDLTIPAVKYTIVIQCETVCKTAEQRRGLRGSDE